MLKIEIFVIHLLRANATLSFSLFPLPFFLLSQQPAEPEPEQTRQFHLPD